MAMHGQVAAIPVRKSAEGQLEVLLVTTRETQRWVVPKGWPLPRRPDHEAAANEAWEEAGVRGTIDSTPSVRSTTRSGRRPGCFPCACPPILWKSPRRRARGRRRRSAAAPGSAPRPLPRP